MGTVQKSALGGALGTIVAAAVIAFSSWLFADPLKLLGGLPEEDFAPYKACASDQRFYIPAHSMADKNGCVAFHPALTVAESDSVEVPVASFHKVFKPLRQAILIVTAYATGRRKGDADYSFVWARIKVDDELCSSDEEVVFPPLPDGYSIHATASCVITLAPGKHSLLVSRTAVGVKDKTSKLIVRYIVLSE